MTEIKFKLVDGEPMCMGEDCPSYAYGREDLKGDPRCAHIREPIRWIYAPCIPGLRQQRDELTSDNAALREEIERLKARMKQGGIDCARAYVEQWQGNHEDADFLHKRGIEQLKGETPSSLEEELKGYDKALSAERTRAESAEKALEAVRELVIPLQAFFDYHEPREGYQCEIDHEQQLVEAVRAILDGKGETK